MPVLAKPEFNESTYAFALATEFVGRHRWRLAATPYFPTLEEEVILGWDANIEFWGLSFFFQFKRSEHFQYRKELPCFRFPVYKPKKSPQHNRLVKWSQSERLTYYCAPCFTAMTDLTLHSVDSQVMRHSKLVPARSLPELADSDTRQHYVTFSLSNHAAFRSRPTPIEDVRSVSDVFGEDSTFFSSPPLDLVRIDSAYVARLNGLLDVIVGSGTERAAESDTASQVNSFTGLRARLREHLGVEWLLFTWMRPRAAV